ncbi:M67 family peptidase [Paenibacillus psychroresistens]|uniref:M67 family peptidase n=1 Tax=Paenibacillus psychroresistens TaxID=1778678 RepID=A0A6B8RNR7_9BACL|nr:M67 family metallopeptidase [Paenibacillus psychroresistens]QGQ97434.1 M67 family peptidase [Paenibacillus psychroresistens]
MIKITFQLYNELIDYCRFQLPNEACGVFLGTNDPDSLTIKSFRGITNIANSANNQFEFNREELLKLIYSKHGYPWIGIFHSHPLTDAYPSNADLQSPWTLPIYAILSLTQPNQPIMKSFEFSSNQQKKPHSIKEQTIEIIMGSP